MLACLAGRVETPPNLPTVPSCQLSEPLPAGLLLACCWPAASLRFSSFPSSVQPSPPFSAFRIFRYVSVLVTSPEIA